jgi:hypothetical protein
MRNPQVIARATAHVFSPVKSGPSTVAHVWVVAEQEGLVLTVDGAGRQQWYGADSVNVKTRYAAPKTLLEVSRKRVA